MGVLIKCILGDPGAVGRDDRTFTTNILSSRLTAPGSLRMIKMRFAFISLKNRIHFNTFGGVLISKGVNKRLFSFVYKYISLSITRAGSWHISGGSYNRQFTVFFVVN